MHAFEWNLTRASLLAVMVVVVGGFGACASGPSTTTSSGVVLPVAAAPPSFVRTTSEARTTQVFDVREAIPKSDRFKALTDAIAAQHHTIDVSDPHAGFVMTTWEASFLRAGIPDARYRTRLVARFLGDDWKQLSVTSEANWKHGDEWDIGFDSTALGVAAEDLRSKLGKK